jgi:hypothetical protein
MRLPAIFVLICTGILNAQNQWDALSFLEGTWDGATKAQASGVHANGTYIFRKEMGGHVLARHTSAAGCKGPADFNCEHSDLLYIYQDTRDQPLKAIYFDNEGHVIHYGVSTPAPGSAIFISDPAVPGPQYRLVYELAGAVMSGKFQMRMPGKAEWTSYLEWSGSKK